MYNIENQIKQVEALSSLISSPSLYTNTPTGKAYTDQIGMFINTFCRLIQRMCFFASETNIEFDKLSKFSKHSISEKNDTSGFPIYPKIYFTFDAFIISLRAIYEANNIKKAKIGFHEDALKPFLTISKQIKSVILDKYLGDIRNEIVHTNNFGSGYQSMVYVKTINGEKKLYIPTFFFKSEGERFDLMELFHIIFSHSINYLKELLAAIVFHYSLIYGDLNLDASLSVNGTRASIRDIEDEFNSIITLCKK